MQPELIYNEFSAEVVGYNNRDKVFGGDLISISHTEIDAMLTADIMFPEPHKREKTVKTKSFHLSSSNKDKEEVKMVTYLIPEHKTQQVYFKEFYENSHYKDDNSNIFSMWEVEQCCSKHPGD